MILGLTGANASGKGEVAAYLASLGWPVHSLSDVVREEARAQGLDVERETLIAIGQELRREGGDGVLAERILPRLRERAVVDSIRHPDEVRVLQRRPDFRLVVLAAPVEVRFERATARGRAGDAADLAAFREQEALEAGVRKAGQDVPGAMALADRTLDNAGSLDALRAAVDRLLDSFRGEGLEV